MKRRLEINNILRFSGQETLVLCSSLLVLSLFPFKMIYEIHLLVDLWFTSLILLSFKVKISQDENHDSWKSATNGKISNGNAKGNQEKEDEGEEAGKFRKFAIESRVDRA